MSNGVEIVTSGGVRGPSEDFSKANAAVHVRWVVRRSREKSVTMGLLEGNSGVDSGTVLR